MTLIIRSYALGRQGSRFTLVQVSESLKDFFADMQTICEASSTRKNFAAPLPVKVFHSYRSGLEALKQEHQFETPGVYKNGFVALSEAIPFEADTEVYAYIHADGKVRLFGEAKDGTQIVTDYFPPTAIQ